MTTAEHQLYTLLISFLSAIGTISAVIVALYLARLNRKTSLQINADLFEFRDSPDGEYVFIQVTNDGYQPVYIKNILFQYGIFNKKKHPNFRTKYVFQAKQFYTTCTQVRSGRNDSFSN